MDSRSDKDQQQFSNAAPASNNRSSIAAQSQDFRHFTTSNFANVTPKLTQEQHDSLEAYFQKHCKPSTSTKKDFADRLCLPLDKINNWFQNRRAKAKQDLRSQMNADSLLQATPSQHVMAYNTLLPFVSEDADLKCESTESSQPMRVFTGLLFNNAFTHESYRSYEPCGYPLHNPTGDPPFELYSRECPKPCNPYSSGVTPRTQGDHALSDYQTQLMLLEQANKKRPLMAYQEPDNISSQPADSASIGQATLAQIMSPFETPDEGYCSKRTSPGSSVQSVADSSVAFQLFQPMDVNTPKSLTETAFSTPFSTLSAHATQKKSTPGTFRFELCPPNHLRRSADTKRIEKATGRSSQIETRRANSIFYRNDNGVLLSGNGSTDQSYCDPAIPCPNLPASIQSNCSSEDEPSPWSDYSELYVERDDSSLDELKEAAVEQLLCAFSKVRGSRESIQAASGSTDSSSTISSNGVQSDGAAVHANSSQTSSKGKRKLGDTSPNGYDDGDEDGVSHTRRRVNTCKGDDDRLLACPYCKWKPLDYRSCYKYVLKEISRLKQHLWRCHKVPTHCPICSSEFDSVEDRDRHVRGLTCELREPKKWEGITEIQKEKLKRRVDPKKSKRDQWYAIYEILFPGHTLPESPYVEQSLSEELRALQDFIALEGPTIVDQLVQTRLPRTLQPQEEEVQAFARTLFQHAVPAILEQFESSRRNGSTTPDSGYGSRGEAGRITPDDSQGDAPEQITPNGSQDRRQAGQIKQDGSNNDTMVGQILATDSQGFSADCFLSDAFDEGFTLFDSNSNIGQGGPSDANLFGGLPNFSNMGGHFDNTFYRTGDPELDDLLGPYNGQH